jgi:hypothetical protein
VNLSLSFLDSALRVLGDFTEVHSFEKWEGWLLVPMEIEGLESGSFDCQRLHEFEWKQWGAALDGIE